MSAPIKVLHVVGSMNRGGTETWLLNVLKRADPSRFQFTFLKTTNEESAYDHELLSYGGRLVSCLQPRRVLSFGARLFHLLRAEQFDIVHSHLHWYNGIIATISRTAGVKVRVVHSHTDTRVEDVEASPVRRAYIQAMKHAIHASMTSGLSASVGAATCTFGEQHFRDRRTAILHCGIDLAPFSKPKDRPGARSAIGIAPNAIVGVHVGRMEPPKNHELLISAFAPLAHSNPQLLLLLIGDGSLRSRVCQQIEALRLRERVRVLGSRGDAVDLLATVADFFVLPSRYEGLGLAFIEAQAAGLPCVVSANVPLEADVMPQLVTRVRVDLGPTPWTDALRRRIESSRCSKIEPSAALAALRASNFNIEQSASSLFSYYEDSLCIPNRRLAA